MRRQSTNHRLSDGNREALLIRWRVILILGLSDYFTNENRYAKLIAREILDMFEGVMKAFAECLAIQIEGRGFIAVFNDITSSTHVPQTERDRLREINDSLSAPELNSIRNLFRNPESHTLNLPLMPVESVMRCWRLFNDAVAICDSSLLMCAQGRPELTDFVNLHRFFYIHVVNQDYIDLRKIKLAEKTVIGKDGKNRTREVTVEYERTLSEVIEYIASGDWITP